MLYMNEYEVEEECARYASHPVLGPATRTLANLVDWTNRNSDGWAYWPKPVRAAKQLQQLIQGKVPESRWDTERADATPDALKAALRPIKTFRTRHSADFEIVN